MVYYKHLKIQWYRTFVKTLYPESADALLSRLPVLTNHGYFEGALKSIQDHGMTNDIVQTLTTNNEATDSAARILANIKCQQHGRIVCAKLEEYGFGEKYTKYFANEASRWYSRLANRPYSTRAAFYGALPQEKQMDWVVDQLAYSLARTDYKISQQSTDLQDQNLPFKLMAMAETVSVIELALYSFVDNVSA